MRGWARRAATRGIAIAWVAVVATAAPTVARAQEEGSPEAAGVVADEAIAAPEAAPAGEPAGLPDAVPGLLDEPAPPDPEPDAALAPDEEGPVSPGEWAPPEPDAKAFDWLQVRSGEWLKGELRTLRDERVTFDSDEFDELDLDWEKVQALYLARPHSFRVQGRVLSGTAELRGSVLRIRTEDTVFEFDRADLSAIAQGGGRELDWWSLKIGTSATLRQGNASQVDISGNAEVRRETALTRFVTGYRGSFSRSDGDGVSNNHRVNLDMDVYLTRRLYWTVPFAEYFFDEFQRIDARVTSGTGVGYEFFRNAWTEMEASIGAAHQFTRLDGEVEESRESHDFAVVSTLEVDFDLPGGTELDNLYRLQLVTTDLGKTSHHAESELSVDVWGPLDLDVTFIWDRIENPAELDDDADDDPEKNDYRLLVGFSLEF